MDKKLFINFEFCWSFRGNTSIKRNVHKTLFFGVFQALHIWSRYERFSVTQTSIFAL